MDRIHLVFWGALLVITPTLEGKISRAPAPYIAFHGIDLAADALDIFSMGITTKEVIASAAITSSIGHFIHSTLNHTAAPLSPLALSKSQGFGTQSHQLLSFSQNTVVLAEKFISLFIAFGYNKDIMHSASEIAHLNSFLSESQKNYLLRQQIILFTACVLAYMMRVFGHNNSLASMTASWLITAQRVYRLLLARWLSDTRRKNAIEHVITTRIFTPQSPRSGLEGTVTERVTFKND